MSRFPLIEEADLQDPLAITVYGEIRKELGFGIVPNLFKSMAINPPLLRVQWDAFRKTILQGRLPRTLKEMLGVLISQTNGSVYARDIHLHALSAIGMSREVLQMLVSDYERCPLPERDKDVLRFGLLVATDPLAVTDEHFATLRRHRLADVEIFEIIATAQFFVSINAYTDSIALELDKLG